MLSWQYRVKQSSKNQLKKLIFYKIYFHVSNQHFKPEKLQENDAVEASDPWKPNKENREVRRKLRIARKLHELEEDIQSAANQVSIWY